MVKQDINYSKELTSLINIMKTLRDPENGCPWDIAQDFDSIAPHTIEEAYEVFDAIQSRNWENLKEELGDLLLQAVYHSQIAEELGLFNFEDVTRQICEKMILRHPHIFGDTKYKISIDEQTGVWERIKEKERNKTSKKATFSGIGLSLPALLRSLKIQKRVSRTGYDWTTIEPVFEKLEEEITELKLALKLDDKVQIKEEIGDILFSVVNIARHLETDPEDALRRANIKFITRFEEIEDLAERSCMDFDKLDGDQMNALWDTIKKNPHSKK